MGDDGIRGSARIEIGRVVKSGGKIHRGHLRWDDRGSSSSSSSSTPHTSTTLVGRSTSTRNYHRGARNGDRHLARDSIGGNGGYGDGSVYLGDIRVYQGLPWLRDYMWLLSG